eukprot:6212380-Pleurochrysis_carterae.AAC.4
MQEQVEVVSRSSVQRRADHAAGPLLQQAAPRDRGRVAKGHALRRQTRKMLRAERGRAFRVGKHEVCSIQRRQALRRPRHVDVGKRRGLAAPGGEDAIAEVGLRHSSTNCVPARALLREQRV